MGLQASGFAGLENASTTTTQTASVVGGTVLILTIHTSIHLSVYLSIYRSFRLPACLLHSVANANVAVVKCRLQLRMLQVRPLRGFRASGLGLGVVVVVVVVEGLAGGGGGRWLLKLTNPQTRNPGTRPKNPGKLATTAKSKSRNPRAPTTLG